MDWLPYFTQKAREWGLRSFKLQFARSMPHAICLLRSTCTIAIR